MNLEEFICKFYSCDNEEQFLKDIYHNLNCLQQENKILRENAENNDKVVDKVNWENMLLKKENQELKKQLEELKEEYIEFQEKASDIQFELRDDRDNYYERLQAKYREQKEFIKWLEDYLKLFDNMCIDEQGYYDMLEEILNKYKEIIGVSDEKK